MLFAYENRFLPSNNIFDEAAEQINNKPNTRYFSNFFRDIQGSKTYKFVRTYFPLISDRDLRRNYSKEKTSIMKMLIDESRVNEVADKTSESGTSDDPIIATLAIDAAKFKNINGSSI